MMSMGASVSPTELELVGHEMAEQDIVPHEHIIAWTADDVVDYIDSLGLGQYREVLLENAVDGESIIHFNHDELKEVGINSVGHRITILKNIYNIKMAHNVAIEPGHYEPVSIDADAGNVANQAATQSDIQRLVAHIKQRDERIAAAENELRKMYEVVAKLREEILPLYRLVKEKAPLPTPSGTPSGRNQIGPEIPPLPTPTGYSSEPNSRVDRTGDRPAGEDRTAIRDRIEREQVTDPPVQAPLSGGTLMRKFSTKRLFSGAQKNKSPTQQTHQDKTDSAASTLVPSIVNSVYEPNLPSPKSPHNVGHGLTHQQSSGALGPTVPRGNPYRGPPEPVPELANSNPTSEIFKSFRVSMDDPCYKVLPAALKKYNIQADWRQYALYIVYGDQERCLELEEKPLILFKQLQSEGRKPMFMLRRNTTAEPLPGIHGTRTDVNIPPGGII